MKIKCLKEMEIFQRVTGFYRPTKLWNKGKKEEFKARKEYLINSVNIKNEKN